MSGSRNLIAPAVAVIVSGMNAYVKGAIGAAVAAAILGVIYWVKAPSLPVNQSPSAFQIIDKMEADGMPDFELPKLDGSTIKLSDLKDKIVIVNFWASWCNPCVQEFPSMMDLVKHFKGKVVVLAVATDDDIKDVESFTKAFGLPKPGFEVVWDHDKKVMGSYGVERIPESFLVGRDFKLIRKVLGIENWSSADAEAFFKDLLEHGGIAPHKPKG